MANQFMPGEWDVANQEIDQRRKYADLLRQQAFTPLDTNQMVSGHVVPVSWTQGLAKMLQGYMGGREMQRANEDQRNMAAKIRETGVTDMGNVLGALHGAPEQQVPNFVNAPDESGQIPTARQPAVAGDRAKAMALALASSNPTVQGIGSKILEQEMKTPEGVNINGQLVNKYTGQPMGARIGKEPEPYSLKPGEQRFGANNAPLASVTDYNKPFNPDGTPNLGYQKFEIAKHKAGAANTQVSVNTATKPFLSEIGKGAGEAVNAAFNNAQQAVQTKNNIEQIRQGLGNIITGPGANTRITLAQIGETLGINGKDTTEKLQNTRNVIQGLARQELAAAGQMKGQGQITESERKILQRAESGQINELTVPEIDALLSALDKTSNYKIGLHRQNLERLKKDPNMAGVVDYMAIPDQAGASEPGTLSAAEQAELQQLRQRFGGK